MSEREESENYFRNFIKKSSIELKDVIGQDDFIMSLKECLVLPIKFPQLFKQAVQSNILVFGLAGTGKTFLINAITSEVPDATFISVHTSDLLSKYNYNRHRFLIRKLFEFTRERKPCILFIDEIDQLLNIDKDDEHESGRRWKTDFLIQIDQIRNDDNVKLIAATNAPWKLDGALLRR